MWFMSDFVGDKKDIEKKFEATKIVARNVRLSTSEKYLVEIFSAQWRDDMRKTPNVIFGCFRGLGKK